MPTLAWGAPLWDIPSLDLPETPLPEHSYAIVVGAGFTGLSAAVHLARQTRGAVAVLEAGRIGDGASGRTGGIALEDTAAGPLSGFENCLDELLDFDCDLELSGCFELAHDSDASPSPLDWRDGRTPLRATGRVAGGTVHPGKLLASLARAAKDAGAAVHQSVAVTGLEFSDPPRVRLANRVLSADLVILATNGYALELSAMKDEAICMLAVAVASQPLSVQQVAALGLTGPRSFYTEDLPYLWGRLTGDNRLVIGSGLVDPVESNDVAADARPKYRALEQRIRGLHPALREISFTHEWLGPIGIAGDYRPVLRQHPRSPKIWFGGAYSGHGVAQSLRMGRLLAQSA